MENIIRHTVLSEARVTLGPKSTRAAKAKAGAASVMPPAQASSPGSAAQAVQPVGQAAPVANQSPAGTFVFQQAVAASQVRAPTQVTSAAPHKADAPSPAQLRTEPAATLAEEAVASTHIPEPARADSAAQSHAAALIDRLEEELRELRTDLESRRDEAVQDGFEEGRRRGEAQYQERLARLGELLERMEERVEESFAALADPVTEVVYEAVCKIAGEAGTSKDFVVGVVSQALRRTARDLPVSITLSPQSHALIEPWLAEGTGALAADRITWKLEPALLPGGCLISTPVGGLDARLDTQLKRLRDVLLAHPPLPPETA